MMLNSKWIKLSIDANYFVAGERVSGEVAINNYDPGCSLLLKSYGTEKVTIQKPGSPEKVFSNSIYKLSEKLGEIENLRAIYPFSFQLPAYSPATFEIQDEDPNGQKVHAQVSYHLELSVLRRSQVEGSDSLDFIVFNKATRIILQPSLSFSSELNSCWCFARGISEISIEFIEKSNITCKQVKNFGISIKSQANANLASVIAQVTCDIDFVVPGEKPLHSRKIISRFVPEIESIKRASKSLENFEFVFEAAFGSTDLGKYPVSNKTALLKSEYKIQVFAIYDVGFRSKRAEGEAILHVDPNITKAEKLKYPDGWDPEERNLKSFLVESNDHFTPIEA